MPDTRPADAEQDPPSIRPLTRCNSSGVLYERAPDVQAQIAAVLELSPTALVERAQIRATTDPDYLKEETLVYLLRYYRQTRQEDAVSALTGLLMHRSALNMNDWFRSLDVEARKDAAQDVWRQLFERVFDFSSDRGDFFQVRFWMGLERLAIGVFRRYEHEHEQSEQEISIDSPRSSADTSIDAETEDWESAVQMEMLEAEITTEQRAVYREGLRHVPEPQRTAFLLHHYYGWPTEDQDPSVPTISGYFGKTSRTIRNWLKQAEAKLEQWRGAHE